MTLWVSDAHEEHYFNISRDIVYSVFFHHSSHDVVYQCRSQINKLYLIPKQIVSSVMGLLWNGRGLGTGKSYVKVMLLYCVFHRSQSRQCKLCRTHREFCKQHHLVLVEGSFEFKTTAVLPCVEGLSEQLCHCLQQLGVSTVFKSETTLRSHLVRHDIHPTSDYIVRQMIIHTVLNYYRLTTMNNSQSFSWRFPF